MVDGRQKRGLSDFPYVHQIEDIIERESKETDVGGEAFVRRFRDRGAEWWRKLLNWLSYQGRDDLVYEIQTALKLPEFRIARLKFAQDVMDKVRSGLNERGISDEEVVSVYRDIGAKIIDIVSKIEGFINDLEGFVSELKFPVLVDTYNDAIAILNDLLEGLKIYEELSGCDTIEDIVSVLVVEYPDLEPLDLILEDLISTKLST